MNRPPRRLRRRLLTAFAAFAVLVVAVFGLYTMIFMYSVEDSVFDRMLVREVDRQLQAHPRHGWIKPLDPAMQIYADTTALPADLQPALVSEPWRSEVGGTDGRHYHVRQLIAPDSKAPEPAWLVAEVSQQLVVRPIRDRVLALLLITGALMLCVALLLAMLLARRSTRALDTLVDRVENLSPATLGNGLDTTQSDDEVGLLASALERLGKRVQAFLAREHAFTRDASHELRTPLAVITSAAAHLHDESGLSSRGRQHLQNIRHSAVQMQHAIATLLALAREEDAPPQPARIRLVPLLEQTIVEQASLLEGRAVNVHLDVPDDACLQAHDGAARLILANLVGNAFAHTRQGHVRLQADDGALLIHNSADPLEALQRWPAPAPFDKGTGSMGTGLGLDILRRLCDRHGLDLSMTAHDGGVLVRLSLHAHNIAHPSG